MKRLLFTAVMAVFLWGCGGDDPPVAETPVAAAPACPPYQLPEQELRTLWAAMEWQQINADYVDAIEHFVNQQPPPHRLGCHQGLCRQQGSGGCAGAGHG